MKQWRSSVGSAISAVRGRPRAVSQGIVTVIVKADPEHVGALDDRLNELDQALQAGAPSMFDRLPMLHFCSFTIFADSRFGPYFVFENNVDGTPAEYLDALCAVAAPLLHELYRFCPDYGATSPDPMQLRGFLQSHIVPADAAFMGNVGRSARRIRDEASLVVAIEDFLDGIASERKEAAQIVDDVRRFVRADERYAWVWQRQPRLSPAQRLARWMLALQSGAFAAQLLAGWLPFLVELRRRERSDPVDIPSPPVAHVRHVSQREDRYGQNHLASLCYVKPGAFRGWLLKLVLRAANGVAAISTQGRLLGLESLHFAHWSLIDDDARLLFLTNYDGTWENYLDDFIDKTAGALTAIWSNTRNFPRTRFLLWGGARDERRFKTIVRTTQAATNVWYTAYPQLPVVAIENNRAICDGLASERLDAAAWLRRF